jgi:hypothetical protein
MDIEVSFYKSWGKKLFANRLTDRQIIVVVSNSYILCQLHSDFMKLHGLLHQVKSTCTFRCRSIRYFLVFFFFWYTVISIPAETPFFSFIDHVIWRKLQASLLPVWVATPDVNVNTTSFTVKMERPIKLCKDWCCVPQCKSDGRKRGTLSFLYSLRRSYHHSNHTFLINSCRKFLQYFV